MLFSGDDVHKKLGMLSGGESARLIFAQLMTQQPNVLLLDEPTNHLDLEAIEALVQALEQYDGTLLLVSHDRWFVSHIATRIVELTSDGRRDFPGTYEEYLAACGDDHLDSEAVALRARQQRPRAPADSNRLERKRQERRLKARLKALPQKRDAVVQAIEAAEARKGEIAALYCQPEFFREASTEQLASLKREEAELEIRLESLMAEWEALETELEASQPSSQSIDRHAAQSMTGKTPGRGFSRGKGE
jgi:ABC-type multidrug transport system ATPase subunit